MATLTGFTRPSDPINANDLGTAISTALGKTVTVVVTPTDLQVTGGTLVSGDQTATQASITTYFYAYLQYGAPISDNPTMVSSQHGRGVTESVVYQGDLATYNAATGLIGKLQTSAGVVYNAWAYPFNAVTNGSGIATVYLTSDGTITGTPAFTTIYNQSATPVPVGASSNYQVASATISGFTMTITVNQLGSVILGLVNVTSAASGITVQGTVWGK